MRSSDVTPEIFASFQDQVTDIEKEFGPPGGEIKNRAWNYTTNVGVKANPFPQSYVIPDGREVPSAVAVTEAGTTLIRAGVPEYQQVDNSSWVPLGNYTIRVGNMFKLEAAGGAGIIMSSKTRAKIDANKITINSDVQTSIGSNDIVMKGTKNISIISENLNLNSNNQIVMNGNVGMNNNLILKGGAYLNGEVFINHITAPLEVQQTIPGFTTDGAFGFLRNGSEFATTIPYGLLYTSLGPLVIFGGYILQQVTSSGMIVELAPHAHEFPNLPLTLVE